MAQLSSQDHVKETRIHIRVTPYQKEIITRAAKIKHITISEFMLEKSYDAASQVLSEEANITMSEDAFEQLCALLDNPPKENIQAFLRMLTKESTLDEQ